MDLLLAAILSLGETTILAKVDRGLQILQSPLQKNFLLYFVIQYGIFKFYRLWVYPYYLSPLRNLHGPKDNWPLIGHMAKILSASSPLEPYLEWSAKWPRAPFIRYFGIGNREILMINTPEAHKEVLQTYCYSFKKPDILFRLVGDILGRGLLFSEGAEHKRQRRIMLELFSVPNLKIIFPIFQERSKMLSHWLEKSLDNDGKGIFEVVEFYSRIIIDIVGLTMLGVDLEQLNSSDPRWDFLTCYHKIFQPPKLSALINFVNTFVRIRWCLPIEANLGYTRTVERIRQMMLEVVRQRIKDIEDGAEKYERSKSLDLRSGGRDLLTLLVEEGKKFKGTGDEMNDVEIMNQMLTFLTAGHETTSIAMVWATYILATRPDVQNRLRSDVLQVAESSSRESGYRWDKIDRLRYLNNFVKEVVRLFCPPLNSYREAVTDLNICGNFIPKGTLFYYNMNITNHSKASWGEDADLFKPERWDNLQGGAANPFAFSTFSNGPRFCIGKNFAIMEIKTLLVEVISKFRFVETPELKALGGKTPPFQSPSLSLTPKGGLRIGIERI